MQFAVNEKNDRIYISDSQLKEHHYSVNTFIRKPGVMLGVKCTT